MYIKGIFFLKKERNIGIFFFFLELGQIRCRFQNPQKLCHPPKTFHVCGGKNGAPHLEALFPGCMGARSPGTVRPRVGLEPV